MANQEHLNILKQGVEVWNQWRTKNWTTDPYLTLADLVGADLRGADLHEVYLCGASLQKADLREADLRGADFSMGAYHLNTEEGEIVFPITTKLIEANLSGADFRGAKLDKANLNGANLSSADLTEAYFSETSLYGSDFSNAYMERTIFLNVDLSLVKGLDTVQHGRPSEISISTIDCSEGRIPESFLQKAGTPEKFIIYMRSLVSYRNYYSCFISCSSKDQDFVEQLYTDLINNGVRCWFAPEDLKIGDKFRHRIDESIRIYDKLLLVLSEASIASTWVGYEVEKALDKEPEGIPNVLFPIRLDEAILTCETDWAKDIRSSRHIGDFEHWKNHDAYQIAFERLLRDLKAQS